MGDAGFARTAALIEAGADVNVQDDTRQSAYLIPTADGGLEMLRLTLAAGADVHLGVAFYYVYDDTLRRNGGTAVASDWTLSAGSNSVTGSTAGALATDVAGSYALSESALAGYSNTSITCDNAEGEVTSVEVGLGETVTCEFVNDDDAPGLFLKKTVINDNGGTAEASAWTLSGPSPRTTNRRPRQHQLKAVGGRRRPSVPGQSADLDRWVG